MTPKEQELAQVLCLQFARIGITHVEVKGNQVVYTLERDLYRTGEVNGMQSPWIHELIQRAQSITGEADAKIWLGKNTGKLLIQTVQEYVPEANNTK